MSSSVVKRLSVQLKDVDRDGIIQAMARLLREKEKALEQAEFYRKLWLAARKSLERLGEFNS